MSRIRPCPQCGGLIDPFGRHSTVCSSASDRVDRHNAQRDAWAETAVATVGAAAVVIEELRLLQNTEASEERQPGDVTITNRYQATRKGVFDFTVVAPYSSAVLHRAAQEQGHAAAQAEQLKLDESSDFCRQKRLWFVPMAVETFGGWGKLADRAFQQLSVLVAAESGRRASEERRWMYQRHSVALQRDNARMIMRRADPCVPLW